MVLAARHARLLPITCCNQRRCRQGVPNGAASSSSLAWLTAVAGPLSTTSTCSPLSSTGSRRAPRQTQFSPPVTHSPAAAARSALIQNTRSTPEPVTPRTPVISNVKTLHVNSERFAFVSSRYFHIAALAAGLLFAADLGCIRAAHAWPSNAVRSRQASAIRQHHLWRQHGSSARQARYHLGLVRPWRYRPRSDRRQSRNGHSRCGPPVAGQDSASCARRPLHRNNHGPSDRRAAQCPRR